MYYMYTYTRMCLNGPFTLGSIDTRVRLIRPAAVSFTVENPLELIIVGGPSVNSRSPSLI